ncbi:hypothetical protein [Deinococcus hopiensis]|uniref:Uncharacterized protein n=1 Tax=Deinococcus hopiensis KR-140 TaxID=695939 RepID=A0A1W1VIF8_9DEIO|nr:hypothetical protein [Deinococcus hopiensis]SMB93108.1 hypothetical protein SAMN00790413_01848 [Deinococcus hopiensis KR-140]
MLAPRVLVLAALLFGTAGAQAPADCALARAVDSGSYDVLTTVQWSEVDQDNSSYNWAECRAAALQANLSTQPQLRARIALLRKQLREMRLLEGSLAGIRAGGGTMYSHAVPRSFTWLEEQLASLAALARSPLGARTSVHYGEVVREAQQDFAGYVRTLRAYKPKPNDTYGLYDPKVWTQMVNRYETLGKAVMLTLGNRGDAATVVGYAVLTNQLFEAAGEE